jgi:hypothetical protein
VRVREEAGERESREETLAEGASLVVPGGAAVPRVEKDTLALPLGVPLPPPPPAPRPTLVTV